MTGFSSPDVPAYVCYLLIAFLGAVVAVQTINALLGNAEDRWAFVATWGLFFAYTSLPILLFWFLDYTGAIHDTSLFAAAVVGFGYRQIFAGGVQGITMAGQTAALWKPFEAWVDQVSKRISSRNQLYKDRFAEKVKSVTAGNGRILAKFEEIVWANTGNVAALQTALQAPAFTPTNNPGADTRRRVEVLWADLRRSQPDLYGWILRRNGVVKWFRYWFWLGKGRGKLMSAFAIALVLVSLVGLLWWLGSGPASGDRTYTPWLQYHTWRFLKANTTERDRWRSREYLVREFSGWGSEKIPPLPEAVAQLNRASADLLAAQQKADGLTPGSAERRHADAAVRSAEGELKKASGLERRAVAAGVLLPSLLQELRYDDISNAKAGEILSLLVNCHSPALNAVYVPDLIESLRTQNEVVRLETRKALVAVNVDYVGVKINDDLAKWEPKKSDTASDIDQRVRQWRSWWSNAQAVPQAQPRGRAGTSP